MDIEVKVTWDQIGTHGADFEAQWQLTRAIQDGESAPIRNAIATLLETNTTVTIRDDEIGCTLVYRKVAATIPEVHDGIYPHECIIATCKTMVAFDDEPYCFVHSPDSGSSFPAFSAKARDKELGR